MRARVKCILFFFYRDGNLKKLSTLTIAYLYLSSQFSVNFYIPLFKN